jgi:hypothetical protein
VTKAAAAVSVTPSQQSVAANTPVTFTATVAPTSPGGATPTGTVAFYSGSTLLGTGTLDSNGNATLTYSWKKAGNYKITVKYSGDSSFDSVTSGAMTEAVT